MSKELAKTYDPKGIEDRIYQNWLDKKYFHAEVDRVKKELCGIKVLGSGKLEKKLTVKANIFTNQAITKIEELGGTTEVI